MLPDKPIASVSDLPADFAVKRLESRKADRAVLMVTPEHYTVAYAINPHMRDAEGRLNVIDRNRARAQWQELVAVYRRLGLVVETIDGVPGLPDMVFAANQSIPYLGRQGQKRALISNMAREQRRPETDHFASWYRAHGYAVEYADPALGAIEGMGDALWLQHRRLLLVGHGFRTSLRAAESLAEIIQTPVLLLELIDERFYHLDTALAPLDERTCLVFREAFTKQALALIDRVFERVIAVDQDQAVNGFACNAHAPDGLHVLLEPVAAKTMAALSGAGFLPVAVDVSEFRKSGGSVFCMKMMLPHA